MLKSMTETDSYTILEIQHTSEMLYLAGLFKPESSKKVIKCLQNSG